MDFGGFQKLINKNSFGIFKTKRETLEVGLKLTDTKNYVFDTSRNPKPLVKVNSA